MFVFAFALDRFLFALNYFSQIRLCLHRFPDGTFNRTLFEDHAWSVVNHVIGEDYGDDDLPNEAMAMARDIAKRRRRYLLRKPEKIKAFVDLVQENRDKKVKQEIPRKIKKEQSQKKEQSKKNPQSSEESSISDVSRLFASDSEAEDEDPDADLWECMDCQKKMKKRNELFPKSQRQHGLLFRCFDCYNKQRQYYLAEQKRDQLAREDSNNAVAEAKQKQQQKLQDAKDKKLQKLKQKQQDAKDKKQQGAKDKKQQGAKDKKQQGAKDKKQQDAQERYLKLHQCYSTLPIR